MSDRYPTHGPSPLRCGVVWLVKQPYRWNDYSLATLAYTRQSRAMAFLTQLVRDQVVQWDQDWCYLPTTGFDAWAAKETCSHARSPLHTQDYQEERRERMELGEALRALRGNRSLLSVATAVGIHDVTLRRIELGLRVVREDTIARIRQELARAPAHH